ncbi:MAG: hypothetical protein U5L09_02045 [Bacteroidales bacterium]|nr:hypothetical protein [Bacteroidales bacterium]
MEQIFWKTPAVRGSMSCRPYLALFYAVRIIKQHISLAARSLQQTVSEHPCQRHPELRLSSVRVAITLSFRGKDTFYQRNKYRMVISFFYKDSLTVIDVHFFLYFYHAYFFISSLKVYNFVTEINAEA